MKRQVKDSNPRVKLSCQEHPRIDLATFQHGPATGWTRISHWNDNPEDWYLPPDLEHRHEWAKNTPFARHRVTCPRCHKVWTITGERLIPRLDAATESGRVLLD